MNINFNKISKYMMPILISIFAAYMGMTLLFFSLPKSGVNYVVDGSTLNEKSTDTKRVKRAVSSFTKGLKLSAIYQYTDSPSWIVLKDESSNKSFFLKEHGVFKDMNISKITSSSVVFSDNGTEHILTMEINKKDIKDILNNGEKL